MALTKAKKQEIVQELSELLASSKLTVVAKYKGTTVKAMQSLRKDAKAGQTVLKVVKNRLVKQAVSQNDTFKSLDLAPLTGMLLYAFNSADEVAPAQVLHNFAKKEPQIEFVGAFTADGQFMGADDVKALASLPSKDQLRGMLVGTLAAPLSGFVAVMNGNIRGVLNVFSARAEAIK